MRKFYSILMTVLFSIFFILFCFYWIKYRSVANIKDEILSKKESIDSLYIAENKRKQSFDSIYCFYTNRMKKSTKKEDYFLVSSVHPIIVESKTKPSVTKIFLVASFDANYSFELELGKRLESDSGIKSEVYKSISSLFPKFNSFELKNSEIKHPITGVLKIHSPSADKVYSVLEESNIE
jgi:hypothetical protein